MPRRLRVAKLRARPFEYNEECALFLTAGHDYFHAQPFGNPPDMSLARDCWRDHGAELLEQYVAIRPGCRPWGWWQFEAPEERAGEEPEAEYLERLGLWFPGERELMEETTHGRDGNS